VLATSGATAFATEWTDLNVIANPPCTDGSPVTQSSPASPKGEKRCHHCAELVQDLDSHVKTCSFALCKQSMMTCRYCGKLPEGNKPARDHHYRTCLANQNGGFSSPMAMNYNAYNGFRQPQHTPQHPLGYQQAYDVMSSSNIQTPYNGYDSPLPHTSPSYHVTQRGIPPAHEGWTTPSLTGRYDTGSQGYSLRTMPPAFVPAGYQQQGFQPHQEHEGGSEDAVPYKHQDQEGED
jgi:hypothetical protein